jgi:hypothetical protein
MKGLYPTTREHYQEHALLTSTDLTLQEFAAAARTEHSFPSPEPGWQ